MARIGSTRTRQGTRDKAQGQAQSQDQGARQPLILGVTSKGDELIAESRQGVTGGAAPRIAPLVAELFILTKERGVVRLGEVMNHAQRTFLADVEDQLATRGQVRVCVLKARQIGISTIIEAIAFALSMLYRDFSSLIVSHESDSTENILAMTRRYWDTYRWRGFHSEKYASASHLAWTHGSGIKVATAKNLGAGRSRTIHFLHASEVAFWPDPETLMTGLRQSIPSMGLNCIFVESTANGIGNYFYKTCNEAMKGENEFRFHFYPWHEHPEYTAKFIPDDQQARYAYLDDLDEEELLLRDKFGVSDSRLIWRRFAIKNLCQGSVDKFHQEYPTTPHEAFVSTGRNVFPLKSLMGHYEPLIGKKGKLLTIGGKVRFIEDADGYLTLFAEPSDDKDWGVYLLGADPTHSTAGDYACIQVINRRTMEQVAVYRRKIDPVNFGKDLQALGFYFNTALIAPEKTGPGYATVGCVVADNYPSVYVTQNVAKLQGTPTDGLYGWLTNSQTKHLAIAALLKALSDPLAHVGNSTYGLLIHDQDTFLEMRDYVTTEDGQGYENGSGSDYDDGVMALAIATAVHSIEPPPPAYEMVAEHRKPRSVVNTTGNTVVKTRPIDNQVTDKRVATAGEDYTGLELMNDPLPVLDSFPVDFEDDEPPWMKWGPDEQEREY